jgi:hypothetical protein
MPPHAPTPDDDDDYHTSPGQHAERDQEPDAADAGQHPLDLADLGTARLVEPDALARRREWHAGWIREHEEKAAALRRDVAAVPQAERALAAWEFKLARLQRTPAGALTRIDWQHLATWPDQIRRKRRALDAASAHVGEWIARAEQHEAAAHALRAERDRDADTRPAQ